MSKRPPINNLKSIRDKQLRTLISDAVEQGCQLKLRKGNHGKLILPNGRCYFLSLSPSDKSRAAKNVRAGLRREGLTL